MITGACGFLGRNLTKSLNEHELVLIDLFNQATKKNWQHDHLIFHADVNEDISVIKDKLQDVDIVIHLANRARITPSWTQYKSYYQTNIGGSQQLLASCQTMGVKKFIYISSSSVYGNNSTYRQHETSPLCPTNPYAVSKMAAESALKVQASEGPTELITVRPFTMYGDYMDFGEDALVISKFLTAWKRDEPLLLHGGGNQRRDFIHASDAVDGLLRILNHGRHGDVYNLGSGESVSIKEIADVISPKQIIVPDRRGAVQFTEADISRLKGLGFRPKVRILEWLTHCVNEYKLKELI
jgi:UDP-glucose 4-epimerase